MASDISELKELSDKIAFYDDRLREMSDLISALEDKKLSIKKQKDQTIWQLQDKIDELSNS